MNYISKLILQNFSNSEYSNLFSRLDNFVFLIVSVLCHYSTNKRYKILILNCGFHILDNICRYTIISYHVLCNNIYTLRIICYCIKHDTRRQGAHCIRKASIQSTDQPDAGCIPTLHLLLVVSV